jgi:hypothetical protein
MVPHRYHNFGKVHRRADQPKMDRHLSNPHVARSSIQRKNHLVNRRCFCILCFRGYSCLPKPACTCLRYGLHLTGRWYGYTCIARNGANGLCSCSCGPLDGGRLFIQVPHPDLHRASIEATNTSWKHQVKRSEHGPTDARLIARSSGPFGPGAVSPSQASDCFAHDDKSLETAWTVDTWLVEYAWRVPHG